MSASRPAGEGSDVAGSALREGVWFGVLRLLTQAFSWAATIVIARVLLPSDYGIMAMATVLAGYLEIVGELGLGVAIVQRAEISHEELSSIFWFTAFLGAVSAAVAFLLAHPTAWLFNEPRVVPLTQASALLFATGALVTVPENLLRREMRFREIGVINLVSVGAQSASMLAMALAGFGVWTLIAGAFIQRALVSVLSFWRARWRPTLHLHFWEARHLLAFGVNVAASRSIFYFFQRADQFVVGKLFSSQQLGYYSFALQLASIPTDKVISIVQQVALPVFSRYQSDPRRTQELYLAINRYISLGVVPIYAAGIFFANPFIPFLLGEHWVTIVPLFQVFCVMNLLVNCSDLNSVVHIAQGRPSWRLAYTAVCALIMPASIFVAAQKGFDSVAIPWATVFPAIVLGWSALTLRRLGIPTREYVRIYKAPLAATAVMLGLLGLLRSLALWEEGARAMVFLVEMPLAGLTYAAAAVALGGVSVRELKALCQGQMAGSTRP